MSSTQKRALVGSAWTIFGYGAAQVLRLGSNLILAHLLYPAAFGVMALVAVFMQGLQMFSDVGIGPSIIQNRRGEDPVFLNTAWTMQVIRGFVLWLLSCALAWPAAQFFGQSDPLARELTSILPVIGFSSVIGGFNSTAAFTLNRRLLMGRMTMLELIPQTGSVATMILWGHFWPSVWALVAGWMVYSIMRLALSHYFNRPMRNAFAWEPQAAHELLRFGRWILLSTIVAFLATSLDRLVLGRLMTLAELGIYSIALTFARVGIEVTNRLSNTVLFPLLSRKQDDPAMLVSLSLRARALVLMAGGALVSAFAILAPVFFENLYDPRYAAAGEVSRWLSIYVWATIVLASMERVPLALGHPRALFISNLITTCGYGLAIPAYHFRGVPGFIVALAAAVFVAHLVLLAWYPTGEGATAWQSLAYTAVFGAYCGVAIGALNALPHPMPTTLQISMSSLAAALPCAICGGLILIELRKRKAWA